MVYPTAAYRSVCHYCPYQRQSLEVSYAAYQSPLEVVTEADTEVQQEGCYCLHWPASGDDHEALEVPWQAEETDGVAVSDSIDKRQHCQHLEVLAAVE